LDAPESDRTERSEPGPRLSFQELVDPYAQELLALAASMLGNTADAEDVLQETFLGAFRSMDRFEGRSSQRTWLTSILVRQVARRRRVRFQTRASSLAANQQAPTHETVAGNSRAPEVHSAMDRLSSEHRDILLLREVHGLSYDEICLVLDLPRGTVESRLHRARQALRDHLQGSFP
jgi:RNA polymerase sigma-70 factor, ECF subfamily